MLFLQFPHTFFLGGDGGAAASPEKPKCPESPSITYIVTYGSYLESPSPVLLVLFNSSFNTGSFTFDTLRSCQGSPQHWDPAHTHHIVASRHPPAHATSLSRARPTVISKDLGRRRRIENNENRARRSPCWQDKLYSRCWEGLSVIRSTAILPPHIYHRHLRLCR